MGYWSEENANNAVRLVYQQILERSVDPSGLNTWTNELTSGNRSLRGIVLAIGQSDEHYARFVHPHLNFNNWDYSLWGNIIRKYYEHFLDREPESQAVEIAHSRVLHKNKNPGGWWWLVDNFIRSQEYMQRWGEQGVPGVGYNLPHGGGTSQPTFPYKEYSFCVLSTFSPKRTMKVTASSWEEAEGILRDKYLGNLGAGDSWIIGRGAC